MRTIPLFPLGTVLFPGMLLPLHIFEPRYLQMIDDCIQSDHSFGVVALQISGHSSIGTEAKIQKVEKNPDRQTLSILVAGTERFRLIQTIPDEKAYLTGMIEKYPDQKEGEIPDSTITSLKHTLLLYLKERSVQPLPDLPDDAVSLCNLTLQAAMLPVHEKQKILELNTLTGRIRSIHTFLQIRLARSRVTFRDPSAAFDPKMN